MEDDRRLASDRHDESALVHGRRQRALSYRTDGHFWRRSIRRGLRGDDWLTNRWQTQSGGGDVICPDRTEADRRLLAYTTPPLNQDLEVTGYPVVELSAGSGF